MHEPKPVHPPILLYHDLAGLERPGGVRGKDIFTRQMRYLAQHGYTTLTQEQFVAAVDDPASAPPKSVFITFDDGYLDLYEEIVPILMDYGLTATVAVVTATLEGGSEMWTGPRKPVAPPLLSWKHVEEMSASGISFASHSHTHPQMDTLSPEQLSEEAIRSKQIIEDRLGKPVPLFVYPYGRFTAAAKEAVRNAGYSAALAWASQGLDRFELRRRALPPASSGLFSLRLRLSAAYPMLRDAARLAGRDRGGDGSKCVDSRSGDVDRPE